MVLFCIELNEDEDRLFVHTDVGGKTVYFQLAYKDQEPYCIALCHEDVQALINELRRYNEDVQKMEQSVG